MTPFFNPGPSGFGPPPVFLAAVGEKMAEVAGEMADGLFVHGFCTERYLREWVLPTLQRGQERRTASRPFEIAYPAFVAMGETEAELATASTAVRKQGEWDAMGERIEDDVLHAFAAVGTPEAVAATPQQRYGDVVDRISLYLPYDPDPAQVAALTGVLLE
ncbi:LLM class flavin-dependent oxidoreductase [Sporichthya sp.]|uniref:LLM class flavin-dependent oxidoreductase n=1 Tax=Sporichthya sp. TaxID=65475 RepID=UPI00345C01D9